MQRFNVFVAVLTAALAVEATTWKVSLTEADAQGFTGVDALTNAIARAAGKDTIELGPGTYDLSCLQEYSYFTPGATLATWGTAFASDTYGKSSLVVAKTIYYVGANPTSWRDKTPEQETVLKNGGDMRIFYGYTGSGRGSRFSHLTFDGGDAGSSSGGAILFVGTENCNPDTCYATNCVFRNCTAGTGGATCDVTCKDCCFTNNSASKGGAAFGDSANGNGRYTNDFLNCVFVGNSATGSGGGAIYCNVQGQIADCFFSNNTASVGGAVRIGKRGAYSVVSNCTFLYNKMTSTDTATHGGAINNSSVVYNSTFIGNETPTGGGAVDGASPVYSSVFVGNKASSGGATIYSTIVEDCFFTNNVANGGNGGACRLGDGATVRRCTFVGNSGVSGGALYGKVNYTVDACHFTSNSAVSAGTDYGGGAIFSETSASVLDSDFVGNSSKSKGGVLRCNTTFGTISGCTFTDSVAVGLGGCLYAVQFGGVISNCVFNASTNGITSSPSGMHIHVAEKVVDCTFTGYGDVYARTVDRCTFDHNDYLVYSQYGSEALIKFNATTGPGTVRNCLFHDCHVTRLIAADGMTNMIENCTFDNNATEFNSITAHRTGDNKPTNNHIRNCIFSNRSKPQSWSYSTLNDFYATGTNTRSTNFFYHCIFDVKPTVSGDVCWDAGVKTVGDIKFVKDNPRVAGTYPDYMVTRTSPAYRKGEVQDWMSEATDLLGTPRLTDGLVDVGAIQCTIPPMGLLLLLR